MSEAVVTKKGLGVKFWIILGVILLLVLAASAGLVYYKVVLPLMNPEAVPVKILPTHKIPLEPFTVNLKDSNYRRYIRTELTLETTEKKVIGELAEKDHRIRDTVISVFSSKGVNDLADKEALRLELIAAINADLTQGEIVGLYFEQFMIQ